MSDKYKQLFPATEVVGALLTNNLDSSDVATLASDPQGVVLEKLNLEVSDEWNFNIVKNTDKEVHLALPYYDMVKEMSAMELTSEQMEEIAGGEIIISLCIAGGIAAGVGVATAAGGIGIFGTVVAGAIGGTVGAVAGGVAAATAVAFGVEYADEVERPDKPKKKSGK